MNRLPPFLRERFYKNPIAAVMCQGNDISEGGNDGINMDVAVDVCMNAFDNEYTQEYSGGVRFNFNQGNDIDLLNAKIRAAEEYIGVLLDTIAEYESCFLAIEEEHSLIKRKKGKTDEILGVQRRLSSPY